MSNLTYTIKISLCKLTMYNIPVANKSKFACNLMRFVPVVLVLRFFSVIFLDVAIVFSVLQILRYVFQATAPLLKTPLSQAQQAYSAAAATYTAVAGMRAAAYGAAAAAQPVAGYAAVAG